MQRANSPIFFGKDHHMANHRRNDTTKAALGTFRPGRAGSQAGERLVHTPPPPPGLSPAARAHWESLCAICIGRGVLTGGDLPALGLLAGTLADIDAARATIAAEGLTTTTGADGMKPHPAIRVLESARRDAARMLGDFGLNPRARASVNPAPEQGGTDDIAARFFT
jgi:P27 family predicted phage terminase small subunit